MTKGSLYKQLAASPSGYHLLSCSEPSPLEDKGLWPLCTGSGLCLTLDLAFPKAEFVNLVRFQDLHLHPPDKVCCSRIQ